MKKKYLIISTTIMLSLTMAINAPVSAQSNPDSRTTVTESYQHEKDTNYGWIGLLGLIGLAGLIKSKKDVRDGNSPKYYS